MHAPHIPPKFRPAAQWASTEHSGSRAIQFALQVLDDPAPARSGVDIKGLLFACSELVYRMTGERVLPAAEADATNSRAGEQTNTPLPLEFLRSSEFCALSPHATKMLFSLLAQVGPGGLENGSIAATEKVLRPLGWNSPTTTGLALRELVLRDMAKCTRESSGRTKKLYCLTMLEGCGEHFGSWRRGLDGPHSAPVRWAGVRTGERDAAQRQRA